MKHTPRIKTLVPISPKEAKLLDMENKLTNILKKENVSPMAKARQYEDGFARIKNFKENIDFDEAPQSSLPDQSSVPQMRKQKQITPRKEKPIGVNKDMKTPRMSEKTLGKKKTNMMQIEKTQSDSRSGKNRRRSRIPISSTIHGPVLSVVSPPKTIKTHVQRNSSALPMRSEHLKPRDSMTRADFKGLGFGSNKLYIKIWK